jgi:hypothetical protein
VCRGHLTRHFTPMWLNYLCHCVCPTAYLGMPISIRTHNPVHTHTRIHNRDRNIRNKGKALAPEAPTKGYIHRQTNANRR